MKGRKVQIKETAYLQWTSPVFACPVSFSLEQLVAFFSFSLNNHTSLAYTQLLWVRPNPPQLLEYTCDLYLVSPWLAHTWAWEPNQDLRKDNSEEFIQNVLTRDKGEGKQEIRMIDWKVPTCIQWESQKWMKTGIKNEQLKKSSWKISQSWSHLGPLKVLITTNKMDTSYQHCIT